MVTVAVCILALLFAAGSITPLLLSDDIDAVVQVRPAAEQEQESVILPCSAGDRASR